jgi:molecular chaperone DnaK (HSP70)
MYAALELVGGSEATSRFTVSPKDPYEIAAGGHQPITFVFDSKNINRTINYSIALTIDTNAPGKSLTVGLRVERAPIALILPPRIGHAAFVCGDRAVLPVTVRNQGGGVLKVNRIQIDEPKLAAAGQALAIDVAKGIEVTVEVPVEIDKLKPGNYVARGSVIFSNHVPAEYTQEFSVQRPARIRIEPARVSSNIYPIARRDRQELVLQNLGDEILQIESIRANLPWVHPLCKNSQVDPKQRTYVDVFIEGDGLPVGEHKAELEIVSNSYGGPVRVPIYVRVHERRVLPDPIGVDFGTSLSCVATVRDGDPVLVDINPDESSDSVEGRGLPSVVFFEENFFPIVGKAAKKRAEIDPSASVQSVKRLLGSRRNLKIRGKEFTPSEITSEIFRTLLGAVERSVIDRGSPLNAVLTVPADISDEQIRDVLTAASTAGLDIDHGSSQEYVLDEPSAAALYYLWKSRKNDGHIREELVFIYDFGAGTLDCSLVSIARDTSITKVTVLATTGDRQFGGDDVDLAVAQYLARMMQDKNGFDGRYILCSASALNGLKEREYTRAIELRNRFCRIAERAKIQLSDSAEAEIEIPVSPTESVKVMLTAGEFKGIIQPFLSRSDIVIAGCCKQAKVTADQVHTILHTGRGSAIGILRERVNACFSMAADMSAFVEAKQCVAMGAAWWAYIKNLPGIDIQFEGLSPKVPHSIGYRAVENFTSVFKVIFEAGQSYPAERQIILPCGAGRKFELDILEKRFGLDDRVRSRGTVRLPANVADQDYKCVFRLTPQRTLEVLVADHRLEIDPHEDEDMSIVGGT